MNTHILVKSEKYQNPQIGQLNYTKYTNNEKKVNVTVKMKYYHIKSLNALNMQKKMFHNFSRNMNKF